MATAGPIGTWNPGNYRTVAWTEVATGTTPDEYMVHSLEGAVGSVQMAGTWGGATVVFQGSNDGTNWVTLADTSGTAISKTSDGASEFSTAMLYIRPLPSGGTGDDVDVTVILRG